jgi:hypothetical protein
MVIMVPDAKVYPPVPPGRFADIQKIAVLPPERQVETVKVVTHKKALGKILFQTFFPVVPAVNIPYGEALPGSLSGQP